MQLLLDISVLDTSTELSDWEHLTGADEQIIKDEIDLSGEDVSVESVDIGTGANLLVFLLTIVLPIISIPTVLKNGIKDWKWLIDKIKGFIKKNQLVSVDADGAGLLAIDYLAEKYGDTTDMDLMDYHTFNIFDISELFPEKQTSLACRPHNYYVMIFRVGGMIKIISVRSTGIIRELETFSDMPYGLEDIEE